jgi:hypothetical protein
VLRLGRQRRLVENAVDDLRRLLVAQGRERDRRGVELPAAPCLPTVEQLGAGSRKNENRNAGRPVDEVVDEVEQTVVGPVHVLEHDDERPLLGHALEVAAPGRRALAAPAALLAAHERTQVLEYPGALVLVDECSTLARSFSSPASRESFS